MNVGQNSFLTYVSDGETLKSETLHLDVANNAGTYSIVAGKQSGTSSGVTITAVGSYKTDIYGISIANVIRDENGNRIMAYMHKTEGSGCFANLANVTGDGYSKTGAASASNKEWVTSHSTVKFNTDSGVYASYSNGAVQSYYNGWYRQYTINCSVFQTWQSNPCLITSATFQ